MLVFAVFVWLEIIGVRLAKVDGREYRDHHAGLVHHREDVFVDLHRFRNQVSVVDNFSMQQSLHYAAVGSKL